MLSVTRTFHFAAAHKLPNYKGDCQNLHGHSYKLEVAFCKPEEYIPPMGMIVDFKDIKRFVGSVIDQFDHVYLNDIIENPTAENLIIIIRDEILNTPIGLGLVRLRLWETEGCFAEWIKDFNKL